MFAGSSLVEDHTSTTVLDLAHSNAVTAKDLTSQLHRLTPSKSTDNTWGKLGSVPTQLVVQPTAGERLAQRVSPLEPL